MASDKKRLSGHRDALVRAEFLNLLERDISEHPERLGQVDSRLLHRIDRLVGSLDIDLSEPLAEDNRSGEER